MIPHSFRWFRRLNKTLKDTSRRPVRQTRKQLNIEMLEDRTLPAAFTPGDIAVLQLATASSNTTGSILELSPSTSGQSSPVQTINIDSSDSNALRFSSAGTMGRLSDSNDGSLLVFGGANTSNNGTTTPDVTTILTRGIGTLDNSDNYTLQTTYTGVSTNQVRGATSLDDSTWFIADKGGLYTNNATSPTLSTNILSAKSFGGTVYIGSAKSPAVAVSTVSSPTATSLTPLPGMPVDANINDFYLVSSGQNGSTYDVLYTIDAASINKYALVNGTWTSKGSYTSSDGATGSVVGGNSIAAAENGSGGVYLYVSGGTGSSAGNSIYRLNDTAGWNANISITTVNNLTLYTATGTNVLKGIAFTPQTATATTTTITSISPLSVNSGQPVTFTAKVTANSGSTAPTGGFVEFFNGNNTTGTLLATATAETANSTTATFTVTSTTVPAGTFSNIQAYYVSNTGFSNSNTTTAYGSTLTVSSAVGTMTSMASITPLTSNVGTSITFTANVSALSGSTAPGAGSVKFYNGGTSGTLLATATSEITSGTTGTFAVSTTSVPAGNYNDIQAFYIPSTGFASSHSTVFGSTLQINIPGVIAAWTFPTAVATVDNSPAPNLGSGTATTLGMTNNYTYSTTPPTVGSNAGDDVLSTSGTVNTNFTENLWRIRGSTLGGPLKGNGWNLSAPEYSQGIELDSSTAGYSNIVFSFDWYSTTQGIRDLQVQYNADTTNPNGWTNYSGPSSSTGDFVATSNDYNNSLLSPVNPTIHIDFSNIAAANNDPHFGVRLVSAFDSTGTLGNVYASAASPPGDIIPYNNNSGNWRFGNLIFSTGVTTSTTVAANPPVGQNPGQPVTFTATVTPAGGTRYPSGTVAFYDGSTQIGTTQTVAQFGSTNVGTASITLSNLTPGVHGDITAQYTPAIGNGLIASGSGMNLVAGDPTDNPISYTINAPQATGVDVSPVVDQSFTGVVATFSDGTYTDPTGFSASITWATGQTTNGTIAFAGTNSETNINGQNVNVSLFTVTGTYTYNTPGTYPISITIMDPNNNTATVNPTARVAYAPLVVNPGSAVNAVAGVALTDQIVATFTDPGLVANLNALGIDDPTTQFSATISWGDNIAVDTGTINYDSTTHIFSVLGSHTYSQSGPYSVAVAVTPLTVSVERIDSSDPTNLNIVGDETADLNGLTDSPSPDFIDQFVIGAANQTSSLYTFSLPTVATAGGNEALTNSSYSVSEGELTLSTNGEYLVTGGYNATVSAWAPQQTFSDASVINRVIGIINGAGVIDTTTDLTDAYSGDNFRGVVSTDGTQFWTAGHAGDNSDYVHYAQYGASTSTNLTSPNGQANTNTVEIFNGQLYDGVRSGTAGIYQVGTGLPTTAGQSETLFIQVPQSNPLDVGASGKPMSPFSFYMADINDGNPTINGVNVAYVADGEMGIARYDHTSSGWQFSYYINSTGSFKDSVYTVDGNGNITATNSFDPSNSGNDDVDTSKAGGVKGLTGRVVNGQVQLFATTAFGVGAQPNPGESLIEVTDPVSGNGASDAFTTLATDPVSSKSELTGVAFTPTQTVSATITVVGTPTANVQSVTTAENTAHAVTLTGSDPDTPPLSLTYTVTVGPSHGSLSGTAPNLLYTPAAGYFGADSFQFTDSNGTATSTAATVSITVAGPGATLVGDSLYLVGGNTNDQLNITPIGADQDGSSGINVIGQLNNVNINNQTYTGVTTIYVFGFGGNDIFQFAGSLTITTVISDGDGNDNLQLGNGTNTVTVGNGNDNIQGGGGSTQGGNGNNTIMAGNGNDNVQLGNGTNVVVAGTGNDNIKAGDGTNTVTAGAAGSTGNIQVKLGNGFNNVVALLGNGNDQVQAGNGAGDTVTITGTGNDQFNLGDGAGDVVTITDTGKGNDQVQVGDGAGDSVSILGDGSGNDQVQAGNGSGDSVSILGSGNENVEVGNGTSDSVSITGTGNEKVQTGNGTGNVTITGTGNRNLHLGSGWTHN